MESLKKHFDGKLFVLFVVTMASFILATFLISCSIDENPALTHDYGRRSLVSPTGGELLENTLGFGIPATVLFFMRAFTSIFVVQEVHYEDLIMIPTFAFYVALLALINISAPYKTNRFTLAEQAGILADPVEIQRRIYGSKLTIGLEQCMLACIWGVKICIWFFLLRLCQKDHRWKRPLQYLISYIAFSFFIIEIVYYEILCPPFHQYWAVPVENSQCASYSYYSIIVMPLNITSDVLLLLIPCYMYWTSQLPLKRKSVLSSLLILALFTIIAAILNKYYNFTSPMTTTFQVWYIREASVALIIANIICCWPLFKVVFNLNSFSEEEEEQGEVIESALPSPTDQEARIGMKETVSDPAPAETSINKPASFSPISGRIGQMFGRFFREIGRIIALIAHLICRCLLHFVSYISGHPIYDDEGIKMTKEEFRLDRLSHNPRHPANIALDEATIRTLQSPADNSAAHVIIRHSTLFADPPKRTIRAK